jgi:hypothetical protein
MSNGVGQIMCRVRATLKGMAEKSSVNERKQLYKEKRGIKKGRKEWTK